MFIIGDIFSGLIYCDWLEEHGKKPDLFRLFILRRLEFINLNKIIEPYSGLGSGYGYGYGLGYVDGYGLGSGYGYGDGDSMGNGYGYGLGYGYGDGDSMGNGYGYGLGYGDGISYN